MLMIFYYYLSFTAAQANGTFKQLILIPRLFVSQLCVSFCVCCLYEKKIGHIKDGVVRTTFLVSHCGIFL